MTSMYMQVRGQLVGVGFSPSPCEFWRWKMQSVTLELRALFTEASYQLHFLFKQIFVFPDPLHCHCLSPIPIESDVLTSV